MGGGKSHLLVGFGLLARHPELRKTYCGGIPQASAFVSADIATRAFANLLTAAGKKKNVCVVVSDLSAAYDTGAKLIHRALEKEGKQAEFLLHDTCPWNLAEKIGVLNDKIHTQAIDILRTVRHKPVVAIEKTWYY
jgi:hypothetical protein